MRYRIYNQQQEELKRKIAEHERSHYLVSLDAKLAEATHDDAKILQHAETLHKLEQALDVLVAELSSVEDGK
jgi:predicted small metal-binding protein